MNIENLAALNTPQLEKMEHKMSYDERLNDAPIKEHHKATGIGDRFALGLVKLLRVFADLFFQKRYGHRAVVLETVAAVPGMVGGLLQHLKALRHIRDDQGWIRELLEEAGNERMHLMTFVEVARSNLLERLLIMIMQAIFYNFYFFFYLFFPRIAHRFVGYLEEEAVVSYTHYLEEIDAGRHKNVPAPKIAIDYWGLPASATLRDVVEEVRKDEAGHRDRNHEFADSLDASRFKSTANGSSTATNTQKQPTQHQLGES